MPRPNEHNRSESPGANLAERQAVKTPETSPWTPQAVRALGVSTDLRTAAQVFGMSPSTAYKLVKQGEFPVPVLRAGSVYVVPVAPILAILRIDLDPPVPTVDHVMAGSVDKT